VLVASASGEDHFACTEIDGCSGCLFSGDEWSPELVEAGQCEFNEEFNECWAADEDTRCWTESVESSVPCSESSGCSGECDGDYTLVTAEDLALVSACTKILGNVKLVYTNLTSLEGGLEGITVIDGKLHIKWNPALASLVGFGSLTRVGQLKIESNFALESLAGAFPVLTDVTKDLKIDQNPVLGMFSGAFLQLTAIGDDLYLQDNNSPNLSFEGALPSLATIGDDLYIQNNDAATSLGGALRSLRTVGGSVYLQGNDELLSLDRALVSLRSIGDTFYLQGNDKLQSIGTGFRSLAYVWDTLYIQNNKELVSAGQWERDLPCVEDLTLRDLDPQLTRNLESQFELQQVTGGLYCSLPGWTFSKKIMAMAYGYKTWGPVVVEPTYDYDSYDSYDGYDGFD